MVVEVLSYSQLDYLIGIWIGQNRAKMTSVLSSEQMLS